MRDAGPAVFDTKDGVVAKTKQPDIDAASVGRVVERIIDQVADEGGERGTIGVDENVINALEAEVDRTRLRARHEIGDDFFGNVVERRTRRLRRAPNVVFGERQQLLQKMSGAPDPRF